MVEYLRATREYEDGEVVGLTLEYYFHKDSWKVSLQFDVSPADEAKLTEIDVSNRASFKKPKTAKQVRLLVAATMAGLEWAQDLGYNVTPEPGVLITTSMEAIEDSQV